jgi:hypothetical protein
MITLATEVRRLQEEAEGLLDGLAAASPDHETVMLLVLELRNIHARLVTVKQMSRELIDTSIAQMDSAQRTLDKVRQSSG